MASLSDLFRLLDDVEDYLSGGYRREHGEGQAEGREGLQGGVRVEGAAPSEPGAVVGGAAPSSPPAAEGTRSPADARVAARSESPAPPPAAPGPASVASQAAAPGPVSAAATEIPADPATRLRRLAELAAEVAACTTCGLCRGRTRAVPGEGAIDPLVMVVGEGPGADEDASGRPFVGRAGQYLDKWLEAVQLSRSSNAYIANIVKCRPPGNRDPLPDEMAACRPYLDRQIDLVRPRVILTVGRISSANLTGLEVGINKLRGSTYRYRGIPLIPTYHPSGVLRNPDYRAPVWEDLRRLKKHLDESLS